MKIECGLGVYMLTLADHEGCKSCCVSAASWAEFLPLLERVLGAGRGAWKCMKSYRKKAKLGKPGT